MSEPLSDTVRAASFSPSTGEPLRQRATSAAELEIRPLRTQEELHACVALQRETWGNEFTDVVPASILKVSRRIGGVTAGAFDQHDRLLGFVFGLTGVENGRIVHWSDMLAVRPEARNLGLGRRLKDFQRRAVQALGGEVIYWTYDPLVARNAHLNFNVFGVRIAEYVEDMYGETESPLHKGIGTDRFIVAWPVADAALRERLDETHAAAVNPTLLEAPILNPGNDAGAARGPLPHGVRIEVPTDINDLQHSDRDQAIAWRRSTRAAFARALAGGLTVQGFVIDECARRGYYLLRG